MDKKFILQEIKRIAKANDGKAPGRQLFENETGIRERDWYPMFWIRWSDALLEAGYAANKFQKAFDEGWLLEKFAILIRELRHFPVAGEVRRKCNEDHSFPGYSTVPFNRFGGKAALAHKIIEFCDDKDEWREVVEICTAISCSEKPLLKRGKSEPLAITGVVYLIKSGKYYKIGKTKRLGRREYELSIQLPEPPNTIHSIKTDDPSGIEDYWHKRFSSRRKSGEWFDLTPDDIKAFKRRKFM